MIAVTLPDLRGGGAERVNLILAEEFVRRGHEVELVLMQAKGPLIDEAAQRFALYELGCTRLRQVPLQLVRYLRERRPDALLAAMWPLTGLAAASARLAKSDARVVVSEHNDFRLAPAIKRGERKLLGCFGRMIYQQCDAVVAVSSGVADSLQEVARVPRERITVIHNPVRPLVPAPMEEDDMRRFAGWLEVGPRLIAIGTLKTQKRFDLLLHALAEVRTRVDARLLILGDGPLRGELQSLAAELGVANHLWLPGFRGNPGTFLQHADIFVLSSSWEGFGNVVVEALAAGVPVVSTDCLSGPSEILANGKYGRLVPVANVQELARAIVETLANPPKSDFLRTRAKDFSPERAAGAYLRIL